jgi:hypothetical protein
MRKVVDVAHHRESAAEGSGSAMNELVSVFRIARHWTATSLRRTGLAPAAAQQVTDAPDASGTPVQQPAPEQAVVDASFEAHVEEALRIIRSAPTLTVVTLPDDSRAARL